MTERHYRVEVSGSADRDLRDIATFLTEQGARAEALTLVDKLFAAMGTLDRWPRRGPRPPELIGPQVLDIRQLTVGTHRLVYVVAGDLVVVLLIIDGRRDVGPILRERMKRG